MKDLFVILGKYLNSDKRYAKKELPISKSLIDNKSHYDYVFSIDNENIDINAYGYLNESYNSISLLDAIAAKSINNEGLVPISVEGDGFCLMHALSKCFFGNEIFYAVIRQQILIELELNKEWYCRTEDTRICKNENKNIFDVNCSICQDRLKSKSNNIDNNTSCIHGYHLNLSYVDELYNDLIVAAQPDVAIWSPIEHLQVFSNVIKRPICLFGSLSDIKHSNSCYTFLPLRHSPEDCFKYPIAISWHALETKSHFVALTRTGDRSIPMIPPYCQPNLFNVPPNNCNMESNNEILFDNEIAKKYINFQHDGSFSIGSGVSYHDTNPADLVHTLAMEYLPSNLNPSALTKQGFIFRLISKISLDACREINDMVKNEELCNDFKILCQFYNHSTNTASSASSSSSSSTNNNIISDPFKNLKVLANLFSVCGNITYFIKEMVKYNSIQENLLSFYYLKFQQLLQKTMNRLLSNSRELKFSTYIMNSINKGIENLIEKLNASENSSLLLSYYTRLIGIYFEHSTQLKLSENLNPDNLFMNTEAIEFIKIIDNNYIKKIEEIKDNIDNEDEIHQEVKNLRILVIPSHYVPFYSDLSVLWKGEKVNISFNIESSVRYIIKNYYLDIF
jgi:hypothetical protein